MIDFSGTDPSGYNGKDIYGINPFIDTAYFDFAYDDTDAGERMIDAQYASATLYAGGTEDDGDRTLFSVNFADGCIKGHDLSIPESENSPENSSKKTFYVIYVRGNTDYGQNDFKDNGDGTITDAATGLMWTQEDSGTGLNWEEALAWVAQKNAENYLGYSDWRLPDPKQLQSIVDYTRSPDTTGSAAINALFYTTPIINEAGQTDFPCYWTGTTHADATAYPGVNAVYIAFGRAMGYRTVCGLMFTARGHSAVIPKRASLMRSLTDGVPREMPFAFTTFADRCGTPVLNPFRVPTLLPFS